MTAEPFDRLEHLFKSAMKLPLEERAAFLDAECPDDRDMRLEVESLLAAAASADEEDFLTGPPSAPTTSELAGNAPKRRGTRVGRYTILKTLGRGGMADVYLASQEEPFRRYVALKLMRSDLNTQEVMSRFSVERQILASLNHPGIARLIDGGITNDRVPFIVMEYVEGHPITTYCDNQRLTISERLRLFMSVCESVGYAHQNLVLHRDIKPSNILVNARREIKLLDFGIAKLLNPHMGALPLPVTREQQRILTPEYASPEQVRGESLSTASDVYSLGVLLYELITGVRPHDLSGRSAHEVMQVVSEVEPISPSVAATRVADHRDADGESADPSVLAAARGTSPEGLRRRLRGDLDAIALTALRKEPRHRYESPRAFAEDIGRHLALEPVLARRGSRRYRFAKHVRRHRVPIVATAIVITALVIGLGAAMWQAAEARREHNLAQIARAEAEEVTAFLEGLFAASDPYAVVAERLDTVRVRAFLDRGTRAVRGALSDRPLVQARMLDAIGRVYRNLALYREARPLLESALRIRREGLADDHPDLVESLSNLGMLLYDIGEYEQSQSMIEEGLAAATTAHGPTHAVVASTLNHLAVILRERGHYDEAEKRHLEAIRIIRTAVGEDDPRLGLFINDLVATLEQEGDYGAARAYGREAVAIQRRLHGDAHPRLAIAIRELGLVLQRLGEYQEAERLFRESLAILEESLGPEHAQVADLLNRLASVRWWQKDLAAADSLHRRSLTLKRTIYGDVHIEVAYGLNNLSSVVLDKGDLDEAVALGREALEVTRRSVGREHSNYWIVMGNLGKTLWVRGDYRDAERLLRSSLTGVRRTIPDDSLRVPLHEFWLGRCLVDLRMFAEAESLLADSYSVLARVRGASDSFARDVAGSLDRLYSEWGRPDEATRYRALAR
jgi:serine/threonine-protein kinase